MRCIKQIGVTLARSDEKPGIWFRADLWIGHEQIWSREYLPCGRS
jgi:hypothetical protein